MVEFQRRQQDPRSERILSLVLAVLYLAVVAMILYFRFVSYPQVTARLAEQGTVVLPDWFHVVFTLGPLAFAVFLGLKGLQLLRRGLRR